MKVLQAENISKQYRLGTVGSGTLRDDLTRWWHKMRGKEDPLLKVGETNERDRKGLSDYVWALRDVSFEVEQGDVLGIIGRNGAGKSTLLKILSKVTAPTTGSIKVRGRIASLLEVGTGFHPELTGKENIYLNGAILGMRRHEITRKLDEIVEFAGVERYLDTPVKRYSSGMYVRLAFAVAAHLESEILIVDEVLAVGDAEFQKKCLGKMKDVSTAEGRTVLFVSHNMAAVGALCNRGLVLKNGTKVFEGNQKDAIKTYLSSQAEMAANKKYWNEEDAPGDERAKILAIEAIPTRGDTINFESGITLIFHVKSNLEKSLLDISFNLKSHDQILLLHHGNYLCRSDELSRGLYKIHVTIPPFILNAGSYTLDAWLGLSATELVGKPAEDALSFDVESSHIDHIVKNLPGILRPKLQYRVDFQPN